MMGAVRTAGRKQNVDSHQELFDGLLLEDHVGREALFIRKLPAELEQLEPQALLCGLQRVQPTLGEMNDLSSTLYDAKSINSLSF